MSTSTESTTTAPTMTQTATTTPNTTTIITTTIATTIEDTTTVTTMTSTPGKSEMSPGGIVGVVIACVCVGVFVLLLTLYLWRRKKKKEKRQRQLIEHPLPDTNQLHQIEQEQLQESKKQKKKSKDKKSKPKPPEIEPEPPSNISVSSVGYVNVPKKHRESPYANLTKTGAPALPEEEASDDYEQPVDPRLEYSAPDGIGYYISDRNVVKKEGEYDQVVTKKQLPKIQSQKSSNSKEINTSNLSGKDYVNVPEKLAPGQAPKPGQSVRRDNGLGTKAQMPSNSGKSGHPDISGDLPQEVYENVEDENDKVKSTNHRPKKKKSK